MCGNYFKHDTHWKNLILKSSYVPCTMYVYITPKTICEKPLKEKFMKTYFYMKIIKKKTPTTTKTLRDNNIIENITTLITILIYVQQCTCKRKHPRLYSVPHFETNLYISSVIISMLYLKNYVMIVSECWNTCLYPHNVQRDMG